MVHCATASFAHENTPHKAKISAVVKEQKDWGIAGDAASVKREIALSMGDNMRFTPDAITIKQGETIRFVVKNQGKQLHEMVIGTKKELDEHAALIRALARACELDRQGAPRRAEPADAVAGNWAPRHGRDRVER